MQLYLGKQIAVTFQGGNDVVPYMSLMVFKLEQESDLICSYQEASISNPELLLRHMYQEKPQEFKELLVNYINK
jgi:hypothetical protein